MEPMKKELQLVSNMIMCGDHPSITKTELNAKESKPEEKDSVKKFISYGRITPTSSHTRTERVCERARTASEHALRRRVVPLPERDEQGNRALVQAAMGSFRWPPYLLCVWVAVLVLTHALHALVAVLDCALPALRKCCQYFRAWTEACWKREESNQRVRPLALACATGALYVLHGALYALHAAALWAVEPLCSDDVDTDVPKVIDYTDDAVSKLNLNLKQ